MKWALIHGGEVLSVRSERTEADSIVSLFFHQVAWVLWFSVVLGGGVVMFVS